MQNRGFDYIEPDTGLLGPAAKLERMKELETSLLDLQATVTWIVQYSKKTNTEIPNSDELCYQMRDTMKLMSKITGTQYQVNPAITTALKQERPVVASILPIASDGDLPGRKRSKHEILSNFVSRFFDTGSALILLGLFWLVTGLEYYFAGYQYGLNNLAYAISFTNVGTAYKHRRIISGLAAAVSAFQMVLISTHYIPSLPGLVSSTMLFAVIFLDYIYERGKQDLIKVGPRLRYWLGIHLHVFAFLGLMHFPFLYFFIRLPYGTTETYFSVHVFQLQTLFIGLVGIYEKAKPKAWGLEVPKIGFVYVIFVIVTGLILEFQPYLLILITAILVFYAYALGLPGRFAGKITNLGARRL